jgi:hypothetical protein
MNRAAWTLLTLFVCACEPAVLPAPSILSVEPEKVAAGSPAVLSVRMSAVLPLMVDYQEQAVDPAGLAMTVTVGGDPADIAFVEQDGTLLIRVPEGLAVGGHDVRVVLADGRQALLERAFSVVPAPTTTDNPQEPDPLLENGIVKGGLTGFQIDPIGEQVRNTPFKITVRAVGPEAKAYGRAVTLRASKGQVMSVTQGAFVDGVRVDEITLSHPGRISLLVEDSLGNRGLSNSFPVRPH